MPLFGRGINIFRLFGFGRERPQLGFVKKPICVVEIGELIDATKRKTLDLHFAFTNHHESFQILAPEKLVGLESKEDFDQLLIELSPARYLFIGTRPKREQLKSLKNFDIPFLVLEADSIEALDADMEKALSSRGKIAEIVGRRNAIYVHAPKRSNLPMMLKAYFEARRQYPDLLLMMSGVEKANLEALHMDLDIITEDSSKGKRQLADVLISPSSEFLANWAATANVCILLVENDYVEEMTRLAIGSGSAVVAFDLELHKFPMLSELESIGAIWSVQRPNLLAVAIGQALSPEKTALTALQGLERMTVQSSALSERIDVFLNRN